MKKNNYKITDNAKKIMIAFLAILLIVGVFGIGKLSQDSKNTNSKDTNKVAVTVLDQKEIKKDNNISHNPARIEINSTFKKKVVTIYSAPATPNISDGTKYCVLTFDDGPGVDSTNRILNVLAKYNIKGTWFVLGSRVHTYPQMAQKIANAGHEIANHSYSHPDLSTLSYEGYMKEINATQNAIASVTGKTPALLRPPYGSYTADIAANCGLGIALWNVDSLDWSHRYAPAIYNQVFSTLHTHSIILFHDIYNFTAEAVEMIVPELVNRGYKFVTYSQYLQLAY